MDFNKYYESIAEEIDSKIGRLNSLTTHGPSIGLYHEVVLKDVIRKLLPARFGIVTGIIIDDDNRSSKQQDIIIVDENNPGAYIFKEDGFSVVHYKSVIFTIEVKTSFNKKNFLEACENCDSVSKLSSGNKIQKAIFFYYAKSINFNSIANWYKELKIEDTIVNYPTMIAIFNRVILQLQLHKDDGTVGHHPLWDTSGSSPIDGDLLAIFLGTIRKSCSEAALLKPLEFSVLNQQRLTCSHSYFAFGKGAVHRETL